MKKIIIVLVAFSLFLLVSCSNKDEEAEAFIQYNNEEWVPINEIRNEKLQDLPSEMTELEIEGREDEVIAIIENELLPTLDEVISSLESVEPEHEKIKRLNDLQIEAEQLLKDKSEQDIPYYEGSDISDVDIKQNNIEVEEKFKEMNDYRNELIEEYNLEYVEENESLGNFRNLQRKED